MSDKAMEVVDEVTRNKRLEYLTAPGIGGPLEAAFVRGFERATPLVQTLVGMGLVSGEGVPSGVMTLDYDTCNSTEKVVTLPLPITSIDAGSNADEAALEECGRKVGSLVERAFLGMGGAYGSKQMGWVYGLCNYPERMTMTNDLNPADGVLGAVRMLTGKNYFGPYVVVSSGDHGDLGASVWSSSEADVELAAFPLPELKGKPDIVVFQATHNVIRAIQMVKPKVVLRYGVKADMEGYLAMTVTVPQVRSDAKGNCGVVHIVPE